MEKSKEFNAVWKIETTSNKETGTIWTQIWNEESEMVSSFISDGPLEALEKASGFLKEHLEQEAEK